jgi:hypothetical protein
MMMATIAIFTIDVTVGIVESDCSRESSEWLRKLQEWRAYNCHSAS